MVSLVLPLRCFSPQGSDWDALGLADVAAACLRTAHLLADHPLQFHPTTPTSPQGDRGSDETAELKPGVTVRRVLSAPSAYDPGHYSQSCHITAVGWPGARLRISADTSSIEASATLQADTPRAAISLWKALQPALREKGWRDVSLADAQVGPALEANANVGHVPVPWALLRKDLFAELVGWARRWAIKDGTLSLGHFFPSPLAPDALAALLAAVPEGSLRRLELPWGVKTSPPADLSTLAQVVELSGAFAAMPPPSALASLEALTLHGEAPDGFVTFPWDELPRIRKLSLDRLAVPPSLYLSPTLRELSVTSSGGFGPAALEETSSYGPLRLERLELRGVAATPVPSASSLQHLSLIQSEFPAGGLPPLTSLRSLRLYACRWTSLPEGLAHCTQLEELHVEDCPLTTLEGLPPLPSLRKLVLRRTRLDTFPAELERLPALESLETWYPGAGLTEPELRARLPRLRHLQATGS